MSEKIHFTLPTPLRKWVQRQAASRGYASADHFVVELLRREKALEARQRIDAILLEALESGPSTPMTSKDWREIRRRYLERRRK
jgi:Arc/MetJ-type ribon-helix-helix transcriptional regulator